MSDSHLNSSAPWQSTHNHGIPGPVIVFDVLQILGPISISATLFVVLFFRIRRSIGWFSFMLSWGFSGIGNLLIVGRQTGPPPDPILCLCQSMLTCAFPALCGFTFVGLALEIFLSISYPSPIRRATMVTLYLVPYGVFVGILITVFILGHFNPTAVRRTPPGMLCQMSISLPIHITSGIVIFCMIISLILGVCIALKYRRYPSASRIILIRNGTSFGLIFRLGLIFLFSILSIGLAIISMFHMVNESWFRIELTTSALPAAVGILFGTQRDILRVLMFWRKPSVAPILPVTSRESEIIIISSTESQPQNINDSFKDCKC